jgi:DNA repair protein RecO (recombination protein O)
MIVSTRAVVLKTMKYGESSRIARIFTADFGKISVIAKGVRGPRGRFAAALAPMNVVSAVLYKKERTELHLLTQCDLATAATRLHTDLESMAAGMGMVELVDVVTHSDDPNSTVYSLLVDSLQAADAATSNVAHTLYRFEARLLDLLGFRPRLDGCTVCGTPVGRSGEAEGPRPGLAAAGVLCGSCAVRLGAAMRLSHGAVGLLSSFLETPGEKTVFDSESGPRLAEAGRALRWLYSTHVHGFRELKSERVFASLVPGA